MGEHGRQDRTRIVPETTRRADRHPGTRYGNRPTMKDVAARAGVGLKTVSRVVNGEPGVTPDTERRVQEAIDALGFRRNDSARVLRKGRTASIGLVLEDLADPFYGPLSRAVEEVARAHGALLINGSSAEDPEREQELALALCARRVDGLVVIPAGMTTATWSRRSGRAWPPCSWTARPAGSTPTSSCPTTTAVPATASPI
jgi:LacI family transcriptional regulator